MQKEIYFSKAWVVDSHWGIQVVPYELCNKDGLEDFIDGKIGDHWEIVVKEGWLARMSMPGYMDCTEWTIHDSEEEAEQYLNEYYGDDDEDSI